MSPHEGSLVGSPIGESDASARPELHPAILGTLGLGGWAMANAIVALLYCGLGLAISVFCAQYGLFPAPIWLPASISVAAALMGGWRLFPGILVASFAVNYGLFDPTIHEAGIISFANALGPVVGAAATRRFRPHAGLFNRFSGVVVFIACNVLLHPAVTATGGVLALSIGQPFDLDAATDIWVRWWLSDSGGALCFAPALLLWLGVERESAAPPDFRTGLADHAALAAVAAAVVVIFAALPLEGPIRWAFPFLLVLPVSWIALRMSLRAAYTLIALVAVVAGASTVAGYGPFPEAGFGNPLQLVGVLLVVLALNVLTVVSLGAERREAETSSRFKSMFLASASHDLRTPLNAIVGFSEVILAEKLGPIGNSRYREYVEHIRDSGLLLVNIIDEILDLSRIEAGRRELHPTMLDAHRLAENCVAIVARDAEEKAISLNIRSERPVIVFADDLALRQILLNLLSNAVKFTPQGGRIDVRIRAEPSGAASIEVLDTGIGMDAEGIKVALEPFGQIDSASRTDKRGAGLGLPIAVRLAELHGGALTVASTPGVGTEVRVTLPAPKTEKVG